MKHKNNSKRYNDDFRKMVVELYHTGQKVCKLSSKYSVSEVTIYAWEKCYSDGFNLQKSGPTPLSLGDISLS